MEVNGTNSTNSNTWESMNNENSESYALAFSIVIGIIVTSLYLIPEIIDAPNTIPWAMDIIYTRIAELLEALRVKRPTFARVFSLDFLLTILQLIIGPIGGVVRRFYRLFRLLVPSDEWAHSLMGLGLFLAPFMYRHFSGPCRAYFGGIIAGLDNGEGKRMSRCELADEEHSTFKLRALPDPYLESLYCSGQVDGFDLRATLKAMTEQMCDTWDRFQVHLFLSVLAVMCVYVFMTWLLLRTTGLKGIWARWGREDGGASLESILNREHEIKEAAEAIAKLKTQIKELESRASHAESAALKVQEDGTKERRLMADNLQNTEGRVEFLQATLNKELVDGQNRSNETARLHLQLKDEATRRQIAEETITAIRNLMDIIMDEGVAHHLKALDEPIKECAGRTVEGWQQLVRDGQAYGLGIISKEVQKLRKKRSEQSAAAHELTEKLKRELEEASYEAKTLKIELANRPAPEDDEVSRLTAKLEEVSKQYAEVVLILGEQRSAHDRTVAELQDQHTEALTTYSNRVAALEIDLKEADEAHVTIKAANERKDTEIKNLYERDLVQCEMLEDRTREIHDMSCVMHKWEVMARNGIWSWAHQTPSGDTAEALTIAEEEVKELKLRLEAAQSDTSIRQSEADKKAQGLEEQVKTLEGQVALANSQLLEAREAAETASKRVEAAQGLEGQLQCLDEQINLAKTQVLEATEAAQRAQTSEQATIQRYESELSTRGFHYEGRIRDLLSEGESLQKKYEELQAKTDEQRQKYQLERKTFGDTQLTVIDLRAQVDVLSEKLRKVQHVPTDDVRSQQLERFHEHVKNLEAEAQALNSDKIRLSNTIKGQEEELRKAKIAQSNKNLALSNPLVKKKQVNPLQSKVYSLQKELEQCRAALEESQAEKERMAAEASDTLRRLAMRPIDTEVAPVPALVVGSGMAAPGKRKRVVSEGEEAVGSDSKRQRPTDAQGT
ncbi:hypothetical protein AJ80_04133 [Polytolypa hystricis UAMH7299]|uniref:Uncharacterized protein n=1 Tax=Polytolypa hystricis (strain UAMH7299) TaxID=1447883 RepID=A0A2B7YF81_POLH7|nr:hypothetical protein AJ80_04133 [Polytolypa hystricis UAMH7299]